MDSGNSFDNSAPAMTALEREMVLKELDDVLASSSFRSARRQKDLLRYVVNKALEGKGECLKERAIGSDVFERPADYDTGEDSIVRVNASDLRKRLAQFYAENGQDRPVILEVPSGSYAPSFRWRSGTGSGEPDPSEARRGRRWWIPAAAALVLAAAGLGWWTAQRTTPLEDFWRPVLASRHPVLVCVPQPPVYLFSGPARDSASRTPMPPTIPSDGIIRDATHYVGLGDALAMSRITSFFASRNKEYQVRISNDMSFAELRDGPAVLVGAFSNQWTMQVTADQRFIFDYDPEGIFIRDRMDNARLWRYPRSGSQEDYAIVSRVFDSRTGDILITAAGLSHFGTLVAGEFVTSPEYFNKILLSAPSGWQQRNIQVVVKAEVIGRTPATPKIVATWFW